MSQNLFDFSPKPVSAHGPTAWHGSFSKSEQQKILLHEQNNTDIATIMVNITWTSYHITHQTYQLQARDFYQMSLN